MHIYSNCSQVLYADMLQTFRPHLHSANQTQQVKLHTFETGVERKLDLLI